MWFIQLHPAWSILTELNPFHHICRCASVCGIHLWMFFCPKKLQVTQIVADWLRVRFKLLFWIPQQLSIVLWFPQRSLLVVPWRGFLCFSVFSLVENKGCNLFYHPLNFHPPLPNVPTFAQKSSKSCMDFLPLPTDFCPLTFNFPVLWYQTAKKMKLWSNLFHFLSWPHALNDLELNQSEIIFFYIYMYKVYQFYQFVKLQS